MNTKQLFLGFLLSIIYLFPTQITAQISGTITIQDRPIADVHVSNINQQKTTHSNRKGQFSINQTQAGDTIVFEHLLYATKEVIITTENIGNLITIKLEEKTFDLAEITVKDDVQNLNVLSNVSLATNPVNSSQELLRHIPGLVIGQHAGGGKAEQIFLRGFDIDHGTDIRISVDGLPVNMVSHAHGQGYADLHFLLPEVVEKVDFGKGPYYTTQGNFATAGYVNFETKESLAKSTVGLSYGRFNTMQVKGLFNLLPRQRKHHAYIAGSYQLSDGPFETSQNFNRANIFAKYTGYFNKDKISVQAGSFYSRWDASGQIPQRAVDSGLISRFGAIDDTEGGQTSRTNIVLQYKRMINDHTFVKSNVYFSNYFFELYSNFTFFLNDSINGDQIKQLENRNLWGGEAELNHIWSWNHSELHLKGGLGIRHDDSNDNELSHTKNRKETLEYLKLGNIDETNISAWLDGHFKYKKWRINAGIRLDYFRFNYVDLLDTAYQTQAMSMLVASPKLNILYTPSQKWQFYLKTGIGFHSNDARVAIQRTTRKTIPLAYGADLGTIWKPHPKIMIDAAAWVLFSEQEMVYVGDEAIVEPSDNTLRLGGDLGFHYQILDWLFLDLSGNYTYARILEAAEGENYIPLAAAFVSSGGLSVKHPIGLAGGIRYRYVHNRPANEDYSILAPGYGIVDMNINYTYRSWRVGIAIENLLNSEWNETQFATESRLENELQATEEIHFTPGTPFFIKGSIEFSF